MRHLLICLALLGLAGLLFSGPGGTAAQDQFGTQTFSGNGTSSFAVDQFDTSLGTLVSVQYGIELDGEWEETVTSTVTDTVGISWDTFEAGYYPPLPADIGGAGYSLFSITMDSGGPGAYTRPIWRPVDLLSCPAGVPTASSASVDTQVIYSAADSSRGTLRRFTGSGVVNIPTSFLGTLQNAGPAQGTLVADCTANATLVVRYNYIP